MFENNKEKDRVARQQREAEMKRRAAEQAEADAERQRILNLELKQIRQQAAARKRR